VSDRACAHAGRAELVHLFIHAASSTVSRYRLVTTTMRAPAHECPMRQRPSRIILIEEPDRHLGVAAAGAVFDFLLKKISDIPPGHVKPAGIKMSSQHKFFPPRMMTYTDSPELPFLFMTRTLCARIWMRLVAPTVRTIMIRNRIAPWLAQTGRARRHEMQRTSAMSWQSSPEHKS
jgi:hypothetical protein